LDQALMRGDGGLVFRAAAERRAARGRCDAVMVPGDARLGRIRLRDDPRRGDQPGERSRRIGAAREAEEEHRVAFGIGGAQADIGLLDDRTQTEADRAAEPMSEEVVHRPDAGVVEHGLRDAGCIALGDQPRADARIAGVESGDVGRRPVAGFAVPGAVDQRNDALHGRPLRSTRSHPSRSHDA
jgi:hypothetical protein